MKHLNFMILIVSFFFVGESYGDGYVTGSGTDSCGTWVKQRKTNDEWYQSGQWLHGFVSAASIYSVEKIKKVDSNAMLVFMDNYCQQKPLNTIVDAAVALVEELEIN